jgi:hypothetical protein
MKKYCITLLAEIEIRVPTAAPSTPYKNTNSIFKKIIFKKIIKRHSNKKNIKPKKRFISLFILHSNQMIHYRNISKNNYELLFHRLHYY